MVKRFFYRGKTLTELKSMELKELIKLLPSRQRRSLSRGFTDQQKILLKKIDRTIEGDYKKTIKTQCRDMIVIPKMVDLTIHVHKGKEYIPVKIFPTMIGMYLGELALTRNRVAHSAPGVGATKSSSAISVR
jgi:small subunit ribosomal protein S19